MSLDVASYGGMDWTNSSEMPFFLYLTLIPISLDSVPVSMWVRTNGGE